VDFASVKVGHRQAPYQKPPRIRSIRGGFTFGRRTRCVRTRTA